MSIRDAARASGLSPKALRRRIERGTLGSVMVGGRRRIPVDDLVRRGLVPDADDSIAAQPAAELQDPVVLARRVRALESRVAALESVVDRMSAADAGTGPRGAPLKLDESSTEAAAPVPATPSLR